MTPASAGRLFLAVALPVAVRTALAADLARHGPLPGRPVSPEGWHLTLRFLGDTPAPAAARLREVLAEAPLGSAFYIRLAGYGAFPGAARASVLWLGVDEGAEPLHALAAAVEAGVRYAGFPPENRPFRPHLTLSRIRAPLDVRSVLDRLLAFPLPMPVADVVLFRSHLGGGPPRYEAIARFALH